MASFVREKKIYCGKDYLEVDIFSYTEAQSKRKGTRSRKEKVSLTKQIKQNDKNARRYLTQLINSNFGIKDLHTTLTYKDKYLPETIEEAEKQAKNFLRRVSYKRKKDNKDPLKYILITEVVTEKDNQTPVRIHHHIVMNGGLDRDEVEGLWTTGRGKNKDWIGTVNADRLKPDTNGLAALANYLSKYPQGKKRWKCSQNLIKPWSRTNDNKYSRRQVERLGKAPCELDYWKKKYTGWSISEDYGYRTTYNDHTGWSIYLKLKRDVKKGSGRSG